MLTHTEPKLKTCKECRGEFLPFRPMQTVCGPKCALKSAREQRKREVAEIRERKEKIKSVSAWEAECRAIVQKIARIRDRKDGCISCHMGPDYQGRWHGSHYRSVGACSALQFNLWNIHKACAQCNLHKGGNREGYRPRLIEKSGAERVEWMDAQNAVSKRNGKAYIEYLKRFKQVMGKRLRRMEPK